MAIATKTAEEIEGMRVAGRLAAEVLDFITPHVKPGVTTGELDRLCHDYMTNVQGTTPAPLNYAPPGGPYLLASERGVLFVYDATGSLEAFRAVEIIVYRSSKREDRGKAQLYEHEFKRPLPRFVLDRGGRWGRFHGGSYKIEARGIVG